MTSRSPGDDAHQPSRTVGTVVVLGTGGTIAGEAAQATDNIGYTAAQRSVQALVAGVPALAGLPLECEQVAQLDSKDMSLAVWAALACRCAAHLARPEVAGVVVTHGTDTLEETAWLLNRVLAPGHAAKPVVMTAAMRPATSLQADGPQNLLDAVTLARTPGAHGVMVALAGSAWAGAEVRKVHPWRLEAFHGGDAPPVAWVREGAVLQLRPWPGPEPESTSAPAVDELPMDESGWSWVETVSSHAGADGRTVQALVRAGVQGLVVATTGNGSVHHALEAALGQAVAGGVPVMRATRCQGGGILEAAGSAGEVGASQAVALPSAGALTPAQARVELLLRLLAGRRLGG